jgi:Golgi SNAP receptor complex protein 2
VNALYTHALRQSTSLQTDLTALEQAYASGNSFNTASLNGQVNASFAALNRTIDDYDTMARREIVEAKREKALR